MIVLLAGVDVQTLQRVLGDDVAGHHAADGHAHGQLGLVLHQDAVLGLLQTTHPAGVGTVVLLLHLVAGQDGLAGVDDDDVVAAVGMGGIGDFALTAQQVGHDDGGLAQRLAGGVNDVPLALDVGLVCHESGHGFLPPIYYNVCFTFPCALAKIGTEKAH